MNKSFFLREIIALQKKGVPRGICSICSSNPCVIEATIKHAQKNEQTVLIEATSNQVNQYGGYTGMTPPDFRDFVYSAAERTGFPCEKIILGGDHLGPNPFQHEKSSSAMEKARVMIEQFVSAGFTKIHIDTSMPLGDDPGKEEGIIDPSVIADRCARLCGAAEEACKNGEEKYLKTEHPVYVIGTEVPVPGGSDEVEEGIKVTSVSDFRNTVSITKGAFVKNNLKDAWDRVIAVVVQPGVEFGDHSVIEYDRKKAEKLKRAILEYDAIIFEAHSTDYQTASKMKQMVEDGFAILKVGPALTFALREALFILCFIENELFKADEISGFSNFMQVVDTVMRNRPEYWEKYYPGEEFKRAFARKYSLFDRIRYYMPDRTVKTAFNKLINNLKGKTIPLSLLSQFMPGQYRKIRNGLLVNDPEELLRDKIINVIADYSYAAGNG